MKPLLGVCCALLLFCSNGLGDSITLSSIEDTTISENNAANVLGTDPTMIVGRLNPANANAPCRSLLRFNLTGVPSNAIITSASLTVYLQTNSSSTADTHALHRMGRDWLETNATWLSSGDRAWETPGGDFNEDPDAVLNIGATAGLYTFASTPALVDTVQRWVTNAPFNSGWMLRSFSEDEGRNARRFNTREAASGQPTLTVDYTLPTAPQVKILSVNLSSSNVVMKSTGTNGWLAVPEFSSNLVVSNWTVVPQFSNSFLNGTNITVFNRLEPICGSNVFLRMKNVKN